MGQLARLLLTLSTSPPPPPNPNGLLLLTKTFNKFPTSRLQFPATLNLSTRKSTDQTTNNSLVLRNPTSPRFRHVCKMSNDSDMMSQLELGKPDDKRKQPDKRVNGIFWILLINLGVFAADHWFHVL
ncbi:hypothetical protein MKW94_014410 [Papaver nudicaule]|uniref:Uncharacterized protein n=1 Tax=Papaver nudicaule TaxID=74823 RepID=A0AA41VCG1_PAPNU|nr:hypothetical protein [Papaver nudicaule]